MQKEWYTIKEIVEAGLLDDFFFKKTIKPNSKYEHIRLLIKSGKLKAKKFTGTRYEWVKVHIDWINEYKNNK